MAPSDYPTAETAARETTPAPDAQAVADVADYAEWQILVLAPHAQARANLLALVAELVTRLREYQPKQEAPPWLETTCPAGRPWESCEADDCGVDETGAGCSHYAARATSSGFPDTPGPSCVIFAGDDPGYPDFYPAGWAPTDPAIPSR